MDLSELKNFQKLTDIIQTVRGKIREILQKHYAETPHNDERKNIELQFFNNMFQFVTRKWVFNILWELEINGKLGFNEMSRNLGKISSRLLSDRLKELKGNKMINREVLDTNPPSVNYELTDKGKGFC